MVTPTRTLAAFASTLSHGDIPTAVHEATKQYLLDTIGSGAGGGAAAIAGQAQGFTTILIC